MMVLLLVSAVFPVAPGESIQQSLDGAAPGDTVLLLPGVHSGTGENLVSMNGNHDGVVLLGSPGEPGTVVLNGEGLSGPVISLDGLNSGPVGRTTVLSGFTVTGGEGAELGGGLYSFHAEPSIIAVTFQGCGAASGGGACVWRGAPAFVSCRFEMNTCGTSGAGLYVYASDGTEIRSCVFQGNSSDDDGGAVFLFHSSPVIWNCLFSDNHSWDNGGGIYCYAYSSPDIGWCTFFGNSTTYGGSAVYFRVGSEAVVHDCVVTGNTSAALWMDGGGSPSFDHNCIWGNPDGDWGNLPDQTGQNGNISQDPLFVQGYHLSQVLAGQPWDSPCVNAGSVSVPASGLLLYWTRTDQLPDEGQADMGFHYGPQPQYTGIPPQTGPEHVLVVMPSPASGRFTASHPPGPGTLELYDLSGRRVMAGEALGSGHTDVDAGMMPPGVYLFVYRSGAVALSRRIVLL